MKKKSEVEEDLVKPLLVIPEVIWKKLMSYVLSCPVEIQGFGTVTAQPHGQLVIDQVFILEQTASEVGVDADQFDLSRFIFEMTRRGDNPGRIKFQWHSHVNTEAFFSATDVGNIESWQGDWLISLVANKRGEFNCRLDVLRPIRIGVKLNPVFTSPISEELMQSATLEISQKVKQRSFGFRRAVRTGQSEGSQFFGINPDDYELWTQGGDHGLGRS